MYVLCVCNHHCNTCKLLKHGIPLFVFIWSPPNNITFSKHYRNGYGATLHPKLNMYYGVCWTPQQQCNHEFIPKWHRSNVKHTNNWTLYEPSMYTKLKINLKSYIYIVLNAQQVYISTFTSQCLVATNLHI
jgi:hypothetical protein